MDRLQDQLAGDGVEQPPQAKRRISRLQHMKVSKSTPCDQEEDVVHKPCSVSQQCWTTSPTRSDVLNGHDVTGKAASAANGHDPSCSGPCTQTQGSIDDAHVETQKAGCTEHATDDLAVTATSPKHVSACQQELEQQCQDAGHQNPAQCSPRPPGGPPPDSTPKEVDAVVSEDPTLMSSAQQHAASCATKQHCTSTSLQLDDVAVGTASSPLSQEQQLPKELQQSAQQAALVPTHTDTAAASQLGVNAGVDVDVAEDTTTTQAATQQQEHPETATAPAQAGLAAVCVEDEDDDDDWEDQPAPLIPEVEDPEAGTEGRAGSRHAQQPAGATVQEDDDHLAHHSGPSSRRREQYDDEEDWESLVGDDNHKARAKPGQQSSSTSGQASGSASGDMGGAGANILMQDEEDANAATQRLLRESAARSGFSKGFTPQVAPLSSLLSKLQARQAALSAKAGQTPMTAAAAPAVDSTDEQQQQAPSLEQVRAHLERHSVVHKQQQQQQPSGTTGGDDGDDAMECDAAAEALALAGDADNIDDFFVEPAAPQQQQVAAATTGQRGCGLLPDTQQTLLDELPALRRGTAAAATDGVQAVGTEVPAELDLHLGDDVDDAGDAGVEPGVSCRRGRQAQCAFIAAEAEESEDGQDAAASSQEDGDKGSGEPASGDEEMDNVGRGGSVSGDGASEDGDESDGESDDASDSDPLADLSLSEEDEEQQQDPEVEPEPLNWEEEEGLVQGSQDSQQQQHRTVGRRVNAAKLVAKLRHKAAAYGFVDAEAELSDDEEAGDLSEDEDGDEEDADGMLEELLADATEGRLDETRRAALHARWGDAQEAKEIRELLNAIKNGFRKKRRLGAGLEGDEDEEGTDAEARRRRARLLGLTDGDGDGGDEDDDNAVITGTDRLQRLDFSWRPEDEVDPEAAAAAVVAEQAARQKRQQLAKLTKQASESQQDGDVMQLLQMEVVDEDSQHTVDLLTKSFSVPSALPSAAAGAHGSSGSSREAVQHSASSRGQSNLRHASGPSSVPQPETGATDTAAAAPGPGAAGRAGGAAVGLAAGRKVGNKQTAAAGFNFTVFGKDIEAAGGNVALKQKTSSFIGRQGSASVAVRSASNYGASRTFVFGTDLSNYSNPNGGHSNQGPTVPMQQHHGQDSRAGAGSSKLAAGGVGASSFAGLGKLIAEGKGTAAGSNGSKQGGGAAPGGSGGGSVLLNVLHNGAGSKTAASAPSIIHAAVGTKLGLAARGHDSNPGAGRA